MNRNLFSGFFILFLFLTLCSVIEEINGAPLTTDVDQVVVNSTPAKNFLGFPCLPGIFCDLASKFIEPAILAP